MGRLTSIRLIFLELISITPILIILGNVVPPYPIKIHLIGFGIIFLLSLILMIASASKKWMIYLFGFYLIIQFMAESWNIKNFIDFFFGPFVLLIILDLLVNNRLPKTTLIKYQKRFYYLLWVPPIIAAFQHFGILPLQFWNATYVNFSSVDGIEVPRPNGLLYHGSELSIILCYLCLFQFFQRESKGFWLFLILITITSFILFKAILATTIVLFFYYLLFVNQGPLSKIKVISKKRLFAYGSVIAVVLILVTLQFFNTVYFYTGYWFPPSFLTGRGLIWNIYIEGIKDFTFWQYLFGSGFGSDYYLFKTYGTAEHYHALKEIGTPKVVYDAHNTFLSVFINSGLLGLGFISFIFRMVYNQVKTWTANKKWNTYAFIAVFILPLLTIGITIPILDMAIIWPTIGFILIRWYTYSKNLSSNE